MKLSILNLLYFYILLFADLINFNFFFLFPAMFYVYWFMLLALTLDEDFDVRKTISTGVVQLPKASLLIFEEILQDFVTSETPEMTCLVAMLYQNTKKVSVIWQCSVEIREIYFPTFWKNIRESNVFIKELTIKRWFHEIFFINDSEFLIFPHCVFLVQSWETYSQMNVGNIIQFHGKIHAAVTIFDLLIFVFWYFHNFSFCKFDNSI